MYADDTSIYRCPKDMPQLNTEINEDLVRLDEWLLGNKFLVNVTKLPLNKKTNLLNIQT